MMDALEQLEQLEKRETTDLTYLEACVLGAGQRKSTRNGAAQASAELARYQALEAAAREARIALTFYREWMLAHGTGETRYPFGEEAEQKLAALLGAKHE